MFLSESLQEKWAPVLNHNELGKISDPYRRAVTAVILENQEQALIKEGGILNETAPANVTGYTGSAAAGGPAAGFDPILISLVRRAMPNLIAYDVCGVQPMTGPTGLIFAMRSKYDTMSSASITNGVANNEAFFNEADTAFSGKGTRFSGGVD